MNILFLNGGRRCELIDAFRESMKDKSNGKIFASDISEYAPALYKADGAVIFPHSSAPEFLDTLCDFCNQYNIELLVPTIDPDLENLARLRDDINNKCPQMKLLLSPDFTISNSRDKRLSKKLFAELGVEVPGNYSADNPTFPVFVKPFSGSAGMGARKIENQLELKTALDETPDLIVEEFIQGAEYTVDVLCDFEGKALLAVPRKRMKVRGGEVSQGIIELNQELSSLAMRLAEGFKCQGPVTLQFISPKLGRFVATELNARMGGGLPLTIAAGADWPALILDLAKGITPEIKVKIQDGAVMTRYDSSVFIGTGAYAFSEFHHLEKNSRPELLRETLQNIKGIVFDLDDTLYPEKDFVFSAYRAVAEKVWLDHGVEIESSLRKIFNYGRRGDLFSIVLKEKNIIFDEAYVHSLVDAYRKHQPGIVPYTDIRILDDLKKQNFKLGLLTDGWKQVQAGKIKALKLEHFFDAIVLSDELGGPEFWKPCALPFEKILKLLELKPEDAVYIGDNPVKDFAGARKLGMKTIRIRRRGGEHEYAEAKDTQNMPDAEIESLGELKILF
jgi:FMN phosphatase YigB (HAD superfamily)